MIFTAVAVFFISQSEPSVRKLIEEGILARSPLGRFQKQDFSPGVKSFRTEKRCVQEDLSMVFNLQTPPMNVRFPELQETFRDLVTHE